MTASKPEVAAWYTPQGYALMNELVPRERFPKDRPEPLIRQSDHIADVRKLVEALELAQGFLRNKGYSEEDPLLLGAINAALAAQRKGAQP